MATLKSKKNRQANKQGLIRAGSRSLVDNPRFYILLLAIASSIFVASLTRLLIDSDTLFMIRTQQIYGFIALSLWYATLLATPLSFVLGKDGVMAVYLFVRRALGVSGAYFALLHVAFGILGQLDGISGILLLSGRFQQALVFGFIGLVVLFLMAITSFDSVIKKLTFRRWKWLHRLSYSALLLVLLHVWIIGTHMESLFFKVAIFSLISILIFLEAWRISYNLEKNAGVNNRSMRLTLFILLSLLTIGLLAYAPTLVDRYHESSHVGYTNGNDL